VGRGSLVRQHSGALGRDVGGSRGDFFITAGFMNNVGDLNGDGSVAGGSGVVILGTILGVSLGGASGLVSGFIAAVLAAAILVPYTGNSRPPQARSVWPPPWLLPDGLVADRPRPRRCAADDADRVCRPTHRRDEPMARVRVRITSRGTHGVAVGDDYVRRS
jgi:hypothetical protein